MAVRIGSNIASLQAQRRLSQNSYLLSEVMGRLASGQRINRASDDPAGLAVATSLRVDSRVYAQGIRNVNDGVSLLNVAQGALGELSSITQRQLELAEQAATGTLSFKQRSSLHRENAALIEEFNRIVQTAKFNGIAVLDGTLNSGLRLQAGYGTSGSISGSVGVELARTVGTGSFTAGQTISTGAATGIFDLQSGDFNGDGFLDMASGSWTNGIWVSLGNGDGTFKAAVTSPGVVQTAQIQVSDLNGDGRSDIVSIADSRLTTMLSNGDGTFSISSMVSPTGYFNNTTLSLGDFTGDGKADIMVHDNGDSRLHIFSGNGNGTFNYSPGFATVEYTYNAVTGDINSDGKLDLAIATVSGTLVLIGNGDGTFKRSTPQSGSGMDAALVDLDGDGNLDLLSTKDTGENLVVSYGNGDGTFKAGGSYAFAISGLTLQYQDLQTGDFNGDGVPDVLLVTRNSATSAGTAQIMIGNSDGSFKARTTFGALSDSISGVIGDFDRDGVSDVIVGTGWGQATYYDGDTTKSNLIARQDLYSQESARVALELNRRQLDRITQELGAVGAFQSRSSIAVANLTASRVGFDEAASRIEDVDVAQEAATLVRLQILQSMGAAILAQANLMPKMVLDLLRDDP